MYRRPSYLIAALIGAGLAQMEAVRARVTPDFVRIARATHRRARSAYSGGECIPANPSSLDGIDREIAAAAVAKRARKAVLLGKNWTGARA